MRAVVSAGVVDVVAPAVNHSVSDVDIVVTVVVFVVDDVVLLAVIHTISHVVMVVVVVVDVVLLAATYIDSDVSDGCRVYDIVSDVVVSDVVVKDGVAAPAVVVAASDYCC